MTRFKSCSVPWCGDVRAVMLVVLLSLLSGRGYGVPVGGGLLALSSSTIAGTCGNSNGTISITVLAGGTPPYQFSLNGGPSQASNTFNNLAGGVYTVTVQDAVGNTGSIGVALGNIPGPTAFLQATAASCVNDDGQIEVFPLSGTPPFQYSVNGGPYGISNPITGVASGNPSVTILDHNGCQITQSTNVPLNNNLALAMGAGATICQGRDTDLTLTSNASSFSWTPTANLNNPVLAQPLASPASTTTYTVTVALGICVASGTETVTVLPAPTAFVASPAIQICYGQSTQLVGSGGVTYQWSPATYLSSATAPDPLVQQPQQSINYTLYVTGANGCTSVQPADELVDVTPPPAVFAGDDTTILIGQTLPLNAVDVNNIGFTSYQWSPALGLDNPSIQDPVATVTGDILYTVTAATAAGCTGTDSIFIKAVTASDIVVPNAFTPNGDGRNDVLRPHAIGIKDFKYFMVFNRWGQRVFYTTNEGAGWDGTVGGQAQPLGTYVWMSMGLDFSGRVVERQGTVILVR